MWNSPKDMKDAFDDVINKAYGTGLHGELENLAELFSGSARYGYRQALRTGLSGTGDASVDMAWIDKRPITYQIGIDTNGEEIPITLGCELGDMLLIVNEYEFGIYKNSRACMLAALVDSI